MAPMLRIAFPGLLVITSLFLLCPERASAIPQWLSSATPPWQLSRLNNDNSWHISCQGTRFAVDPWLMDDETLVLIYELGLDLITVPRVPSPRVDLDRLTGDTDVVLASMCLGDHMDWWTLHRMPEVPAYGCNVSSFYFAGTETPGTTPNVIALPDCVKDEKLQDLPGGLQACRIGQIYGTLWIKGPCGSIVFAPHGAEEMPTNLAERIRKHQPVTVITTWAHETILGLPGYGIIKQGPKSAVNLAQQLKALAFYSTHNIGDLNNTGVLWNLAYNGLLSQKEFQELLGPEVYMGDILNVSFYPEHVESGTSLIETGVGENGIPMHLVDPVSVSLWVLLLLLFLTLAGLTSCICCCSGSRPYFAATECIMIGFFVVQFAIITISLILGRSWDASQTLSWVIVTMAPGIKEFSYAVSISSSFASEILFGYQLIGGGIAFYKAWEQISRWYAIMIMFNLLAMILVTWRVNLDLIACCLPDLYFSSAPWPKTLVMFIYIIGFSVHGMNNLCRIIFDQWGLSTAIKCMVPAASTMAWLLVPMLADRMKYKDVIIAICAIDYALHMSQAIYWTYYIRNVQDRERERCALYGVLSHMIALLPLLVIFPQGLDWMREHPLLHLLCIWCLLTLMWYTQNCWIIVAMLTPRVGSGTYTELKEDDLEGNPKHGSAWRYIIPSWQWQSPRIVNAKVRAPCTLLENPSFPSKQKWDPVAP